MGAVIFFDSCIPSRLDDFSTSFLSVGSSCGLFLFLHVAFVLFLGRAVVFVLVYWRGIRPRAGFGLLHISLVFSTRLKYPLAGVVISFFFSSFPYPSPLAM